MTAEVTRTKTCRVCVIPVGENSCCLPFKMMMIALFHLKTSLTFLSLPVLFLFAHAAGKVGLWVVAFWLWQPQAHSEEWCSGRIKNWNDEWKSPSDACLTCEAVKFLWISVGSTYPHCTRNYMCASRPCYWLSRTRKRIVHLSVVCVNQIYTMLIGCFPASQPPGVLKEETGLLWLEPQRGLPSPSKWTLMGNDSWCSRKTLNMMMANWFSVFMHFFCLEFRAKSRSTWARKCNI